MKIYTSYYGKVERLRKAGIVPIAISLGIPRFYRGERYRLLAPTARILKGEDVTSNEIYTTLYKNDILKKLNTNGVVEQLFEISNNKPIALICYEKQGSFCHRHLVAEWLKENGFEVEEFENEISKNPGCEQGKLF